MDVYTIRISVIEFCILCQEANIIVVKSIYTHKKHTYIHTYMNRNNKKHFYNVWTDISDVLISSEMEEKLLSHCWYR